MEEKGFIDAPIQLVNIHEDGHMEINNDGITFLSYLKNKKLAILSITGPTKSGKSFLSNLFLGKMNGFKINQQTKGIWIWGRPIELTEDTYLIIVDSEGLHSLDKNKENDKKIFTLLSLMSTMVIYNSKNLSSTIEEFSSICDLKERIKIIKEIEEGKNFTKSMIMDIKSIHDYLPQFIWVLRDCPLPSNFKTPDNYLESYLSPVPDDPIKNSLITKINENIPKRNCFCLVTPILDESKLKSLENELKGNLKEEFMKQFEELESFVKMNITSKNIGNFFLKGKDLFGLIQNYIEYLNDEEKPVIMSAIENVLLSKAKRKSEKIFEEFQKNFSIDDMKDNLPIDAKELYDKFFEISDDILSKFSQSLNDNLTSKQIGDRVLFLSTKMRDDLYSLLEYNQTFFEELYSDAYDEIVKISEVKSLTRIEDITTMISGFSSDWESRLNRFLDLSKVNPKLKEYIMKFVTSNILSIFQGISNEIFEIYSNYLKDSTNQIENYKNNLKKTEDLLNQERKKNEELSREKSEFFSKNMDLESKYSKLERDLKNSKKEHEEMLKIEEQKLHNLRSSNDDLIIEKDRLINQLEKKVDHFEKQIADLNKEFTLKISENEKEITKHLVEIEKLKQQRPDSLKKNDPKDYKVTTLKSVFDNIQSIFSDLKDSVEKLDREKEKLFKSKFLEFSTRELDSKSKFWIDELKQFKSEQIRLISEEYEKSKTKLQDDLENEKNTSMHLQIRIEEEIQSKERLKNENEIIKKELENAVYLSATKEIINQKQNEMIELNNEKIKNLLKDREDFEIKLSQAIIIAKMREDEIETLLILIEAIVLKKREKYSHNINKISKESKANVDELVKKLKIFG